MIKKLFLILLFSPAFVFAENYNFVTLIDEFNNKGQITLTSSSSLFIKNNTEFFKRNIFDIKDNRIYSNENIMFSPLNKV